MSQEEEDVESMPGESVPTCEDCGANFPNEEDLRKHHEMEHERMKVAEEGPVESHKCSICGATFPKKDGLIEHQQAAHHRVQDF